VVGFDHGIPLDTVNLARVACLKWVEGRAEPAELADSVRIWMNHAPASGVADV